MKYILIWMLITNPAQLSGSEDFSSQDSCDRAQSRLRSAVGGYMNANGADADVDKILISTCVKR